ncbi:MAG: 4Fe-4S dicluster domain-containing protein [Bacteroidales bacterium]|nr:4Fe-4S dicluster domain-containing protein [Bacteroidales bacterium]
MKKTTRQRIRFILIFVSFLLFPVTIFYLAPSIAIKAAVHGILCFSLLFFFGLFIVSLFLGRAHCGWACPGAGVTTLCAVANNKPVKRAKWLKFVFWIPWFTAIIMLIVIKNGSVKGIEMLYDMDSPISIMNNMGIVMYYAIVLLFIVLSLTVGKNSFCHHVCWMAPFMIIGRSVANFTKMPSLRIKIESSTCIDGCKHCSNVCPMSIDLPKIISEKKYIDSSDCTLCGECVDACNKKVLSYTFGVKSKK